MNYYKSIFYEYDLKIKYIIIVNDKIGMYKKWNLSLYKIV